MDIQCNQHYPVTDDPTGTTSKKVCYYGNGVETENVELSNDPHTPLLNNIQSNTTAAGAVITTTEHLTSTTSTKDGYYIIDHGNINGERTNNFQMSS